MDEYGRDCPYWAEGELWIGGFGVAKGYRGDSALTGQKFITDQYGRWYRTGDLGRIWDDETIEFLGRKDHQVKIRGHRIELGEIEHAIQEFPGVAHAVVDSTVDSLMSWNYQSVEKILNQLTKMHFRTAKLSETLLLAIKAR